MRNMQPVTEVVIVGIHAVLFEPNAIFIHVFVANVKQQIRVGAVLRHLGRRLAQRTMFAVASKSRANGCRR